MKNVIRGISAAILCCLSGTVLAGYADDRAEIENLSNRYMVAVMLEIETAASTLGGRWRARLDTRRGGG
jgi:hypothetical protein